MHEAIYATSPDIKCVFHAHADQAMFWATTGLNMPNITEATQKLKEIKTCQWHPMCTCLLYTSPSPRDPKTSRMPSSA